MTRPPDIAEPQYPFPPRFRWLKRIAVLSIVLIVAFIALLRWWRFEADRRMAAEVAQLRARGERALIEDFQGPVIADDQNAGASLNNAAAAVALTAPQRSLLDSFDRNSPIDSELLKR